MRRSLLLVLTFLSIFTMAQQKSYDKKWESIDKQQSEGLFKSTLSAINEIYKQAKKEENTQQLIRALLYQSKVMLATTEDEDLEYNVVQNFRKEIAEAKSKVEQSILESMLAETLATYYQSNQWKIRQQTRLENKTSDDFRFWSTNIFEEEVAKLYASSIKEAALLQKEDLKKWEGILEVAEEKQNRELRPTLYDLLVHRAIEGSNVFREENLTTKKELLEALIGFHSNKKNANALLYNEQLLLNLDKDKMSSDKYISELQKLSSKDKTAWYSGDILLELANYYIEQLNQEEEKAFQAKKEWTLKALDVINQIETNYPKANAAKGAKDLKNEILTKSVEISIRNYISPNQNNPFRIVHRNTDKVYFKVLRYKLNLSNLSAPLRDYQNAKEENKQKELDKLFKQYSLEKEFSLELKSFDDYQSHATIAKLDTLTEGSYIVLVSNHPDFKVGKEGFILAYKQLDVTASSLVSNGNELLVTDRESGWALPNKTIEFYKTDKNKAILVERKQTNSEGKLSILTENNNGYFSYRIKGEEVLYNNYFYRGREVVNDEQERLETTFFIDRGIYRPGQTLYFKAILFKTQKEQKNVRKNQKTMIGLYDANGKLVKEMPLVTNEFGSVSGEFILPNTGITGSYYLRNENSSKQFSIEEYKRPKFEVKFDAVKDSFELEKEVITKGKAVAYSGANIDRAKVVYRVYRAPIFPYLPWWRMPIIGMGETEEITQGETITDAEGKFEVKFIAIPEKEKSKDKRTYRYTVSAEVIDSNGETHSSEQTITIGDNKWILSFDTAERVEWEELKNIKLSTKNLNGEAVALKPEINLSKIEGADRVLRETPFSSGDYALYSKEEFVQYFPHDVYEYDKPKESELIASNKINTAKATEIGLSPKAKWKEGYYVLKAFVMDGKDSIQTEQKIYLYKKDKKEPIENELFSVTKDKETYQPGDVAKLYFTSAAPKSVVYIELEYNGEIIKKEQLQLDNNVEVFTVPIEEKYRGNVFVHYYFGKYNTAEARNITLTVPFDNKDLKIKAGTLRDKLQPGDKEIWELTVSGNKKDKFIAEVLATMYDASLNQFASNEIDFKPYSFTRHARLNGNWDTYNSFGSGNLNGLEVATKPYFGYNSSFVFDQINWFGFSLNPYQYRNQTRLKENGIQSISRPTMALGGKIESIEEVMTDSAKGEDVAMWATPKQAYSGRASKGDLSNVAVRRNLEETAFFYPTLRTDEKGNVKIQFTAPESLTEWKFMAMAHTEDLKTANFEASVQTQKELMVVPNLPRFLREGDEVVIASKIVNLSNKNLSGSAQLMLFDAFTMQPIDADFGNKNAKQSFKANKESSDNLRWTIKVPTTHQAVVYRIVASSGSFSDGEESALPILSNRMLVTETLPIYVSEGQHKTFTFDKLKDNQSKTLESFKLSLEMTNNPVWYAIFSLPYLKEYPYEGAEQVFSRYYANLISQHLVQTSPKIKAVFEDWNKKGQLSSKLENNEELKSILLEETPWVREAESETEQMKRIALLFDLNKMQNETAQTLDKLKSKQSESGGFSWFDGGRQNTYITTHIVSGFGHLKEMGIDYDKEIVKKAIESIDQEMEEKYNIYLKNNKLSPSTAEGIQYLYARSYFLTDYPLNKKKTEIANYFLKEFQKAKTIESLQLQAMLALIYNRFNKKEAATKLLTLIKDNSVESEEMGMYWKSNTSGWYWHQAPIETQSLLIEAFDKVLHDTKTVEKMKIWLLKNKQTNRWNSTKATTEAVYALMSTGKDWVNADNKIYLKLGDKVLDLDKLENSPYKGSGYVKTSWNKEEIKPEMAKVEVNKTSPGTAWGAIYWQYFEDLDKITSANTSVKFNKQLFLKKNTAKGPELKSITTKTPIQIGDLVTVRLEIKIDRDMQFVHLKDMRASGFEPINVLSSYKFQSGFGYYESTRDAATHFFIDNLPKGTYVFEYDVRANNSGIFSNGITSFQNMYAPELSGHSEGIKVEIQ